MEIHQKRYRKNPNIVSRKIAGNFILVPIRHNLGDLKSIYTLNEVGTRIWELIDERTNIGKIKEVILTEFETSGEEVEKEIIGFIETLNKIQAIIPT